MPRRTWRARALAALAALAAAALAAPAGASAEAAAAGECAASGGSFRGKPLPDWYSGGLQVRTSCRGEEGDSVAQRRPCCSRRAPQPLRLQACCSR